MTLDGKFLAGALAVGLMALTPAFAQSSQAQSGSANRMGSGDHMFATKAAEGGMAGASRSLTGLVPCLATQAGIPAVPFAASRR